MGSPFHLFEGAIGKDGTPSPILLIAVSVILAMLSAIPTTASALLLAVCVFIIMLGMPHGMFDYLALRKLGDGNLGQFAAFTAGYCAIAGLTWLIWHAAPIASLLGFILIAIFHFTEDWSAEQSRLGASAMATSMIALPAITYHTELSAVFTLIGGNGAGIIADYLRLVAPVFGLVAVAHIMISFSSNAADQARRNIILLAAALFLPPGIGFAVYFCLYHSPLHFAEGNKALRNMPDRPHRFFLYMTLASAAVFVGIFFAQPAEQIDSKMIATTFQTLSILTVPHLLLPFISGIKAATPD